MYIMIHEYIVFSEDNYQISFGKRIILLLTFFTTINFFSIKKNCSLNIIILRTPILNLLHKILKLENNF